MISLIVKIFFFIVQTDQRCVHLVAHLPRQHIWQLATRHQVWAARVHPCTARRRPCTTVRARHTTARLRHATRPAMPRPIRISTESVRPPGIRLACRRRATISRTTGTSSRPRLVSIRPRLAIRPRRPMWARRRIRDRSRPAPLSTTPLTRPSLIRRLSMAIKVIIYLIIQKVQYFI